MRMKDQAEKLRQMFSNLQDDEAAVVAEKNDKTKTARVITITSGKGGVGKTNFSINLGIKLLELGLKVLIIDADLGLSNIDIMLGSNTRYNLSDVINGKKDILEIMEEGPKGLKFISGGSGMQELFRIGKAQLNSILLQLGKLDEEADVILIDTGAGLSDSVLSFVYATDEVIIVTTPEPTSITDAYALIKTIAKKDSNKTIKLVINRAEDGKEAEYLFKKFNGVTESFLGITLQNLGYIINDPNVIKAVKYQEPFVISYKKTLATKNISDIAQALVNQEYKQQKHQSGIRLFINRFRQFF